MNLTPRTIVLKLGRSVLSWAVWSAVLLLAVVFYARFIEPGRIVVERHELATVGRSEGAVAPFTVAFVSDFDMVQPPGRFEYRVRDRINELEPDIIAIGGDLVGGDGNHYEPEVLDGIREWLSGFEARDGTYVVWGEQEIADLDELRTALPDNVTEIQHGTTLLRRGGGVVRICGPWGVFSQLFVDRDGWLRATWGKSVTVARYRGPEAAGWRGVDVTTRINLRSVADSVGVAVMEGPGEAGGYRFHVVPERSEWALIRPGDLKWKGETRDKTAAVGPRGAWTARVRVEPDESFTRVRSRIWPAGSEEPDDWPIDFRDLRPDRPASGTVAVVAGGDWQGTSKQGWDWLQVRTLTGELVLEEPFDDPEGVAARWDNPGGHPDDVLATVLVGHDPRLMSDLPEHWRGSLDLALAGHTHGGQVRMPLFGPLHLDRGLPRNWSAGLVELAGGRARLYVSRGIGVSKVPVRFLCAPEITLITLTLPVRDETVADDKHDKEQDS